MMRDFELTDAQKLDWLRLWRSARVGPVGFRQLVNSNGGASAALRRLQSMGKSVCSLADAEREVEGLIAVGGTLATAGSVNYPRYLRYVPEAPPILSILGNNPEQLMQRPMVAVIGSRKASLTGRKIAALFVEALADAGFVIVSGFARGIDTVAHRASLTTGTIAVLAGGLDRIYPPENEELARQVVDCGGALLSERPLGMQAKAVDFPLRNRLISGMSIALVVVEVAERSGSLITARYAAEQGRIVMAVPGSPFDGRYDGSSELIRQGATLVSKVEHVLEAITPLTQGRRAEDDLFLEEPEYKPIDQDIAHDARDSVLRLLSPAPMDVDSLAREASVPMGQIAAVLLELELEGQLERHPGNRVSIIP